jgi:CDP-glucose 4,6-dehydratase
VFHLGALTIVNDALDDPIRAIETNVMGTSYLFEAIRNSSINNPGVLVASSDKAYGSAQSLPYTEETPLRGEGPYDVSKSCTDLIARSYFLTYGISSVIARCGNIYGGGDLNWSRIIPGTIRALINGEQPIIRSNGKFLRDYIYVEDAVDAYLSMATQINNKNVEGEAFNFSRGEPLSVFDIYEAVCDVTVGRHVEPLVLDEVQFEIKDQHLWSEKAKKILRWESNYSVDEGLRLTLKWYQDFVF